MNLSNRVLACAAFAKLNSVLQNAKVHGLSQDVDIELKELSRGYARDCCMKALILAGGEGTRLRPLTLSTPKPVVPVANIPFLRYQIELLRLHGIHEVILSLGYQPQKIEQVLGDGSAFGSRIHYVVEQTPLGTAGAYKNAESLLHEATVVFNGDILCELDLSQVLALHRSRNATATLDRKSVV